MKQQPQQDTANLGGIVKDLKLKVTVLTRDIERVQKTIQDLESFPIIHQDLQGQVQALARILYHLESQAMHVGENKSLETEMQVLSADLKDLIVLINTKAISDTVV